MNVSTSNSLRLGTRGSPLAQRQSRMIADELMKHHPGLSVELVICKTTGDKVQDRPLYDAGGKGLFTKELEEALLAKAIDFAVHSFKDVPVTLPLVDPENLIIAAVPSREDVRDVLVSSKGKTIRDLPQGANVGTGSLRRRCQLLAIRPDLKIDLIRGNIDTRIAKLRSGRHDAVILALAGLKRSGLLDDSYMTPIPLDEILPAAAQGALAIQCRRDDETTRKLLAVLDDPTTHRCVDLERSVVQALNGDCHSPIAVLASFEGKSIHLQAAVGARDGDLPVIRADAMAEIANASKAFDALMLSLKSQNAVTLLAEHSPG